MYCHKCGKKLPDNAVKCNKCGEVFKEIVKNDETEVFLNKEKEKAAKKAEKLSQQKQNKAKKSKILKIVIPCVAVVLVAAILASVLIIGKNKKEQKEIEENNPELLIDYTFNEATDENALLSLGDIKISVEEYEFFYRQSFSNIQNNALLSFKQFVGGKVGDKYDDNHDYYDEYWEEFSKEHPDAYDFKKPVSQQAHDAVDENGKAIPWQEYIRRDAISTMMGYRIKYALAQKVGMELSGDIKYQVYTHIEGLRNAVSGGGYQNLNQYLQILFGSACDEEFFKNELIREYTASKYDIENNIAIINSFSDSEIKDFYNKNRADYDYIDLCVYEVSGSDAEKTAKKIAKDAKDDQSFSSAVKKYQNESVDKSTLPQVPKQYIGANYSKELGKWAYDTNRKANDKEVFKTQNGYTVALVQKPLYTTQDSMCYREIVINKTDENNNPLSEEKLAEVKALAEQIYSDCQKSNDKENDFSYYAVTKSQGSTASTGGLVQFAAASTLNTSIKDWITDSARKTGDIELFETDSTITIIYFIRNYGEYWNYAVRAQKAVDSAAKDYNKQKKTYSEKYDSTAISSAEQEILKSIDEIYFGIR